MSIQSLEVDNDYNIKCSGFQLLNNPHFDYVLTSDLNGNGTWQPASASTNNIQPLDSTITTVQAGPSIVQIGATGNFTGHALSTNLGCSVSGGLNTDTLSTSTSANISGDVSINRNGAGNTGISNLANSGTVTIGNVLSTVNIKSGIFSLGQINTSIAFANPVTVLTVNGTSGSINLTGFSLAAGATAVVQVTNSAVTAYSVIIATIYEGALSNTGIILATAGLAGGFSINLSNYTNALTGGGKTITGTCTINFMLC